MTLDDLTINETSRMIIDKSIQQLPHAILLSGQRGTGVASIARAIASQKGTLIEVVQPKKRSPNGTYEVDGENGTIIIDDIRQLYNRTRSKFASPQIIIIDFAGRPMSVGAQNAFLKLLEEPQQNVHFILAVSGVNELLPTIVSRCQLINILPIDESQTDTFLSGLDSIDASKRSRIQFIAAGLPAEMSRLASDQKYYESRVQTVQDSRTILTGDSYTRMTVIQTYRDKRRLAQQLIDDMTHQLQLAIHKTPHHSSIKQLDALVTAGERIQANANISLALANVLL